MEGFLMVVTSLVRESLNNSELIYEAVNLFNAVSSFLEQRRMDTRVLDFSDLDKIGFLSVFFEFSKNFAGVESKIDNCVKKLLALLIEFADKSLIKLIIKRETKFLEELAGRIQESENSRNRKRIILILVLFLEFEETISYFFGIGFFHNCFYLLVEKKENCEQIVDVIFLFLESKKVNLIDLFLQDIRNDRILFFEICHQKIKTEKCIQKLDFLEEFFDLNSN